MQVIQTHLRSGNEHLVTWLPVDVRVKVGTVVTLDKKDGRWNVESQYATQPLENIQRGWGLDLPKSQRTER